MGQDHSSARDGERVAARVELFYVVFKQMKQYWIARGVESPRLDTAKLVTIVRSYFQDVDRLKYYHRMDFIDRAKQATYTLKWILKFRPITYYEEYSADVNEYHHTLNEYFALRIALALLKVRPFVLSDSYVELLIYTFTYRKVEEDTLLPLFELLRRIADRGLIQPSEPI